MLNPNRTIIHIYVTLKIFLFYFINTLMLLSIYKFTIYFILIKMDILYAKNPFWIPEIQKVLKNI